jgi:hypothetical protein
VHPVALQPLDLVARDPCERKQKPATPPFAFIPEPQRSQMRKLEQSALQTPRNRTHGNDFKVSILCSIHSTFAPHLSQVSMEEHESCRVRVGNIGAWQQ